MLELLREEKDYDVVVAICATEEQLVKEIKKRIKKGEIYWVTDDRVPDTVYPATSWI